MFPNIDHIFLFEPLPEYYQYLETTFCDDARITVFNYAIAGSCGETNFYVSNNDAASSSLLQFGKHTDVFPSVYSVGTIRVMSKTLDAVITDHQLPGPDMLFIDAQGAEFQIIASLSECIKRELSVIYTEVSTEELYIGARVLDDISKLLAPEIVFAGFAPLNDHTPSHGNAVFIQSCRLDSFVEASTRYIVLVPKNGNTVLASMWRIILQVWSALKIKLHHLSFLE